MRKIIRGRFIIAILLACFGSFALMQASDKKDETNANDELARATEVPCSISRRLRRTKECPKMFSMMPSVWP